MIKPEFIYLILAIIMIILINVHSIVTKIKKPEDYGSVGGIFGVICQIISIMCCFGIFTTMTLYTPVMSWIILILLIFSAGVTIFYITRDFINGKNYDVTTPELSAIPVEPVAPESKTISETLPSQEEKN